MRFREKCWIAMSLLAAMTLCACAPRQCAVEPVPEFYRNNDVAAEEPVTAPLELPCVIRNASLIVLQLGSFEGPSADGTRQIRDVAAILVSNPLPRALEYAEIRLRQGTRTLVFEISHLPAGGRILVTERSQQQYSGEPVYECVCTQWMLMHSGNTVCVSGGDGMLTLTNNGESPCDVTLFYKSYYPEDDFLIGGESRSITVEDLQAGESRHVEVADFSLERTRVVAVKTQ